MCEAWVGISVVPRGGRVRRGWRGKWVVRTGAVWSCRCFGSARGEVERVVKSGACDCIWQIYRFIHGVLQWKNSSLHFRSVLLVILPAGFEARLKIWMAFKTAVQVSCSEQSVTQFRARSGFLCLKLRVKQRASFRWQLSFCINSS